MVHRPHGLALSKRRAAIGGIVLLLLATVLFASSGLFESPQDDPDPAGASRGSGMLPYSGIPEDLDGDGDVTSEEKKAVKTASESASGIGESVTATKGGTSVLLTPPGPEWWSLASSYAATLGLGQAQPPAGASWYMVTSGEAYHGLSSSLRYYEAVHLGFADLDDAVTWVSETATPEMKNSFHYRFGDKMLANGAVMLTVTPGWVDLKQEPYAQGVAALLGSEGSPGDPSLGFDTVDVAFWSIDFGRELDLLAAETPRPDLYLNYWENLGFAQDTTWSAYSRDPFLFSGALSGWNAEEVNLREATTPLLETRTDTTNGMSLMVDFSWARSAAGSEVGGLSTRPDAPSGVDFAMSLSTNFRGAADTTEASPSTAVKTWTLWIDDEILTMSPR